MILFLTSSSSENKERKKDQRRERSLEWALLSLYPFSYDSKQKTAKIMNLIDPFILDLRKSTDFFENSNLTGYGPENFKLFWLWIFGREFDIISVHPDHLGVVQHTRLTHGNYHVGDAIQITSWSCSTLLPLWTFIITQPFDPHHSISGTLMAHPWWVP